MHKKSRHKKSRLRTRGEKPLDNAEAQIVAAQRASDRLQRGLLANTTRQSLADFRRAQREYQAALDRLDRVARGHQDDPEMTQAVAALREDARNGAVTAGVDAGHVYLARTDYRSALREAHQAMALEPDDANALQLRALASSLPGEGWPFGTFGTRLPDGRVSANGGVPSGVSATMESQALANQRGMTNQRGMMR